MDGMVTAGRVGRPFGTKGELMVTLYDTFPRDLDMEEPVYVKIDSLAVPLFFSRFVRRGRNGAVVVFDDMDTEERASELIGLEFSVRTGAERTHGVREVCGTEGREVREGAQDEAEWPEEREDGDELYPEDLVGWDAEFDTGRMGRITGFVESEFNPLFEIELDGAQELIPASGDFIEKLDEKRRKVVFSLPEGLLGLNN